MSSIFTRDGSLMSKTVAETKADAAAASIAARSRVSCGVLARSAAWLQHMQVDFLGPGAETEEAGR